VRRTKVLVSLEPHLWLTRAKGGWLARARKRSKYEPSSDRQDMVFTGQLMPRFYMLSLRELCSRQLLASLITDWFGETAGLHQFTRQT